MKSLEAVDHHTVSESVFTTSETYPAMTSAAMSSF